MRCFQFGVFRGQAEALFGLAAAAAATVTAATAAAASTG